VTPSRRAAETANKRAERLRRKEALKPGEITFARDQNEAIAIFNDTRYQVSTAADSARRKREERESRRMAGESRVEVWFSSEDVDWIDQIAADNGDSRVDVVRWCVAQVRRMK